MNEYTGNLIHMCIHICVSYITVKLYAPQKSSVTKALFIYRLHQFWEKITVLHIRIYGAKVLLEAVIIMCNAEILLNEP